MIRCCHDAGAFQDVPANAKTPRQFIRGRAASWRLVVQPFACSKNRRGDSLAQERRLGECIRVQKETVGLAQGKRTDLVPNENQVGRPTLADAGIDKK
jgi:hypothetical protein